MRMGTNTCYQLLMPAVFLWCAGGHHCMVSVIAQQVINDMKKGVRATLKMEARI